MNDIRFCDPKGKRFKDTSYAMMFRYPKIIWIGANSFHKRHEIPTILKAISHESIHSILFKLISFECSQALDNEKVFKSFLGRFKNAYH